MMRFGKHLVCGVALSALTLSAGWKDQRPVGENSLVVGYDGCDMRIDVLATNLFRVRVAKDGAWTESGMNRYGILKRDWPAVKAEYPWSAPPTDL